MSHRKRAAQAAKDARVKEQAEAIQAALADAGARATVKAGHLADEAKVRAALAKEWAEPHLEHGKDWAKPRVERAWRKTQERVGPQIEDAARKAVPVVDTAHDKFVDEIVPKVVAAVTAAGAAASAGADRARDVTSAKLGEIAHVAPPKKSHKVRKTFLWLLFAGVAAAAFQAWRRSSTKNDPWAEDPWEPAPGQEGFKARAAEVREEFKGVVDDVRHELGDAAEAVGEAAGGAGAKTRETTRRRRKSTNDTDSGAGAPTVPGEADAAAADREMAEKLEEQLSGSSAGDEGDPAAPDAEGDRS